MRHAVGGEGDITLRERFFLLADADDTRPFENNIEFILSGVGVERVLLAGFEAVEPREQLGSLGESGLAHLLR